MQRDGAGGGVDARIRKTCGDLGGLLRLEARDEHGGSGLAGLGGDGDDLRGGLTLAEDDLAEALPEPPVMVDLRETEVRGAEGSAPEMLESLVGRAAAGLHLLEQLAKF